MYYETHFFSPCAFTYALTHLRPSVLTQLAAQKHWSIPRPSPRPSRSLTLMQAMKGAPSPAAHSTSTRNKPAY